MIINHNDDDDDDDDNENGLRRLTPLTWINRFALGHMTVLGPGPQNLPKFTWRFMVLTNHF